MDTSRLIGLCGGLILVCSVIGAILYVYAISKFRGKQEQKQLDKAQREMFDQMDEEVKRAG